MGNFIQDENFKQSIQSLIAFQGDCIVKKVKTENGCCYQFIQAEAAQETVVEQEIETTDEMSQYVSSLKQIKNILHDALPSRRSTKEIIRCQIIDIQSVNSSYKSCEFCKKKVSVRKQKAYCEYCKQNVAYSIKFKWDVKVKQGDDELDVVIFQQDLLPVTGEDWNLYPDHIRKDIIKEEIQKQLTYQMHVEISAKIIDQKVYRQVIVNKFKVL
ncbi:hypothetical protein pb186bvf_011441 [Paramecium bursaria]